MARFSPLCVSHFLAESDRVCAETERLLGLGAISPRSAPTAAPRPAAPATPFAKSPETLEAEREAEEVLGTLRAQRQRAVETLTLARRAHQRRDAQGRAGKEFRMADPARTARAAANVLDHCAKHEARILRALAGKPINEEFE